jgi:arginine repressor
MNISDQKMMRRILDRNPDTTQKELENRLKSAPYEREQAKLLCDNYVEVEYMSRTEQARYVKKLIADLVQNKSTKEEQ